MWSIGNVSSRVKVRYRVAREMCGIIPLTRDFVCARGGGEVSVRLFLTLYVLAGARRAAMEYFAGTSLVCPLFRPPPDRIEKNV